MPGLPPAAAAAVRQSVFGGVAVAQKLHSASLLASVRMAFVHGMDLALAVSGGIAVQPGMDKDGEAAGRRPAITGQAA